MTVMRGYNTMNKGEFKEREIKKMIRKITEYIGRSKWWGEEVATERIIYKVNDKLRIIRAFY
jgi:hypothetical protein